MEILVVDDELAIRKGLAALLEESGYSVRTARDGIAALGAVRAGRPDLVLLDVMMPLMDGFAVCERIRQHDRDIPIVFLTAKDADGDQVRGLEVGADDFVSKGVDNAVLLARIRKSIERGSRLAGLRGSRLTTTLSPASLSLVSDPAPLRGGTRRSEGDGRKGK